MKRAGKKLSNPGKKTVPSNPTKAPTVNTAQEPQVNYGSAQALVAQGATLLSNSNNIPESQLTAFDKMNFIRIGVSKKELEGFKSKAALDYDQLASALSVTRATLINKKGNDKFNPSLSERIISLADIYSFGYQVFEEEARFNAWMFSPNQALGGLLPFQIMDNQFGREEIKNLVGRINYGVYA